MHSAEIACLHCKPIYGYEMVASDDAVDVCVQMEVVMVRWLFSFSPLAQ